MSKVSKTNRLSKLRKDAVKRGIIRGQVYPRKTFSFIGGVVESAIARKNVVRLTSTIVAQGALVAPQKADRTIQSNVINVSRGDKPHRVLHPRPRYVYGDACVPVYEPSPKGEVCRKSEQTRGPRTYLPEMAKKCHSCAENMGKKCKRLAPSRCGSAFSTEILVCRSIQPRPTQRRIRKALSSPRPLPGPSPLFETFTLHDSEEETDDTDELESWIDDSFASTCSTLSHDDNHVQRRFGMFIFKNGELTYIEDHESFAPGHAYFDVTRVFPDPGKQMRSYVEHPFPPGWDKADFTSAVDKVSSWTNRDSKEECKPLRARDGLKAEWNTFVALVEGKMSLPRFSSSSDVGTEAVGLSTRFDRRTRVGLHRLRSIFKKKSSPGVAYFQD